MTIDQIKVVGNGGDVVWLVPPSVSYAAGVKTLTFTAVAQSMSDPKKGYEVYIQFLGVSPDEIVKNEQGEGRVSASTLRDKTCKVACHCKHYINGGCMKGNIEHHCNLVTNKQFWGYQRTTDNPNLVKNPNKEAWLCKHLAGLKDWILNDWALQ